MRLAVEILGALGSFAAMLAVAYFVVTRIALWLGEREL